jgi:hypothetical protein
MHPGVHTRPRALPSPLADLGLDRVQIVVSAVGPAPPVGTTEPPPPRRNPCTALSSLLGWLNPWSYFNRAGGDTGARAEEPASKRTAAAALARQRSTPRVASFRNSMDDGVLHSGTPPPHARPCCLCTHFVARQLLLKTPGTRTRNAKAPTTETPRSTTSRRQRTNSASKVYAARRPG